MLFQLCQFQDIFCTKLANEKFYEASIDRIKLKIEELQKLDKETQILRVARELQKSWEDIDKVLYYQGLLFVLEVMQTKFISWYYDNLLVGYFEVNKKKDLIS